MQLRRLISEAHSMMENSPLSGPEKEKKLKAIFAKFPPDSRMKRQGKRQVMLTGDTAHALGVPNYTSKFLEELTDAEIYALMSALKV